MYILKNALKNITSNKGRNILIGIIVLVIATSSSIALSIKEASSALEEDGLNSLQITANISVDNQKIQEEANGDRSVMMSLISENPAPSLEQMAKYAENDTVKDFYYLSSSSFSATDNFKPYSESDSETETSQVQENDRPMGVSKGGNFGGMGQMGDFTVRGYSSEAAMTEFISGESTIKDGEIFTFDTADYTCVISDVLATFNGLKVGDKISVANPNKTEEVYELTIKGIYSSSSESSDGGMRFSTAQDPANYILMNYNTLNDIATKSKSIAVDTTDDYGNTTTSALRVQTSATYAFADVENYEDFKTYVKANGLSEYYTVNSSDVQNYEQSLTPIKNLSKFANVFLLLVLIIGGIILVVLNIFNIRERKYEVGVLTAIGMNKLKVASQFVCEIFMVTFIAMAIGTSVGAVASKPTSNMLLQNQLESIEEQQATQAQNFGRPMASSGGVKGTGGMMQGFNRGGQSASVAYVDNINAIVDLNLILSLLGIGVILTVISSFGSLVFIMRYEPLKILSNRN